MTIAAAGCLFTAAMRAEGPAGVRIVRLSEVRGGVKLDRSIGNGFEPAFQNLPIVQGAKLKTDDGVAEVEFEDNSSLRLTPDAVVEFPQLSRDATGNTVTKINVLRGTVYVSLSDLHTTTFLVTSGQSQFVLSPSTHMQFNAGVANSTLAVYKGRVQAQVGSSLTTVDQKKTLTFNQTGQVQPQLVSKVEKGSYDAWDKTSVDYHKRYMSNQAASTFNGGSGVFSGVSDLNYYGNFSDAGGCGNMWRPYFAGASFDPYANGIYAQYAGGYSWVSPYPWGWLPYHSGSWQYCSGYGGGAGGWGWLPGNTYVGLANTLLTVKPKSGPVRVGPPHLPLVKSASLVPVQTQPVALSKLAGQDTFVFAKGSAGLGIPRQTYGNLQHASMHAEQHGSATAMASWTASPSSGYSAGSTNRGGSLSAMHSSASSSSGFSGGSHTSSGGRSTGGAASGGGHR